MSRRRRFVLTPEARADLIEIWSYIAEASIDAADQTLARLHDAFTRVGRTLGIAGKRHPYRASPSCTGRGSWKPSSSSGLTSRCYPAWVT